MATTKKESEVASTDKKMTLIEKLGIFQGKKLETFRVRQGLILFIPESKKTASKTYQEFEEVDLNLEQFRAYSHIVETEAQYQAAKKKGQRGE